MSEPLLRVEDLRVELPTEEGTVHAVDGISYEVHPARTIGIVGESGSGKTIAALSTLGLTRAQGARVSGRILFEGRDLAGLPEPDLRAIRGNQIAMVFQDPLSSLHPLYRVGTQLSEALRAHRDISRPRARARAIELLELVGIADASRRIHEYPHQFSGGMRQRVMIAMALANEPKLLIADEPTSALDVTVQAQILDLVCDLQRELGMAIVIISHDLGVVARMADEVAVMYAGRIVESAPAGLFFADPQHPYTWGLIRSLPSWSGPRQPQLPAISGAPPSLIEAPSGCHFHPRCPYARPEHARIDPRLEPVPIHGAPTLPAADAPERSPAGHRVACLLGSEVRRALWRELRPSQ